MTKQEVDAIIEYVETAIVHKIACTEFGADGYGTSCNDEKHAMEAAEEVLRRI